MVSRKGVGRGRRYTVRVNNDGSQQYKRRGCGASIILCVFAIVAVLLAACEPEAVPKQGRGMRTPAVPAVNMANVKSLCDYVSTFVDSPDARGNVGLRAEMSGVPRELKTKAVAYGRNPTPDAQRVVLLQCATLGWSR